MTLPAPRLLLAAALLVGVTACSGTGDTTTSGASTSPDGQSGTADVAAAGGIVIDVRDNSFAPDTAEVAVGDTVTWDFATADRAHDVVFDDDRGSAIREDGSWSTTFDEPGTHTYECTLHSGMTGQITVTG